jgi:hypothetical protein
LSDDCWAAPLAAGQILSGGEVAAIVARVQSLLRVRDDILTDTDKFIEYAEQKVSELEQPKRASRS